MTASHGRTSPIHAPASPRTRRWSRAARRATVAAAGVALASSLTACADSGDEVIVGSAGFTESKILAELYAGVLNDAGFDTGIKTLKNRELYEPELKDGGIHVVPEYAATLAEFLNAKANGADAEPVASSDIDQTVTALKKLAEQRDLAVLPHGQAVDQNAFAVSKEFADRHQLRTLSDLGESGEKVKLAAGDECEKRPFCRPGLEETYGIDVTKIDPKGVGTVQAKDSVRKGTNQLVLTTTTDATLEDFDLVLLEDDKGLQNADNVLPVLNAEKAEDKKITEALNKLTKVLTTEDLAELNRRVDSDREKPKDVAADYLKEKKLVS